MRTTTIPLLTSKPVPVIGAGAMPLSNVRADGTLMPRDEAIAVLHRAFDAGLRLVDTADIYAPSAEQMGHNESIVGEAVRTWSGGRDLVVVVTKIGITRTPGPPEHEWGRDGSRDYLLRAAEASVQQLGFEPDVIINHRVNREQQPYADTVRGMLAVREAGFTPAIGIGNIHLDEALTAWEVSEGTIAAVENERSPRFRGDSDVFAWAIEHGVAFFPWSPFGGGSDAKNLPTAYPEFAAVAAELSESTGGPVTAHEVALAWLVAQGPTVVPIPGFTRAATVDSAAKAAYLELTPEQVARLNATPSTQDSVYPD
ncbi:MAG: aldo/keto reductase [Candidatus Nanopelagicales bacterium]